LYRWLRDPFPPLKKEIYICEGGSKIFWPDVLKPPQMENAEREIYSAIFGEVNISVSVCVEIKWDYTEKERSCIISVGLKVGQDGKPLDPLPYIFFYTTTIT
jgi:hypothetical protein